MSEAGNRRPVPCLAVALLLVVWGPGAASAAEQPSEWPPDTEPEPVVWLIQRRMQAARTDGGEEAVLAIVREELAERVYSGDRGPTAQFLLNYVRDHGGEPELPILDQWLGRRPLNALVRYSRVVGPSQVSGAWYAVKKRLCKRDDEKKTLTRSLVDPRIPAPPLALAVEFVAKELSEYWPEARQWVYLTLTMKSTIGRMVDWRWSVCRGLLDVPAYRPRDQEVAAIRFGDSEIGICILADWLDVEGNDRGREVLVDALNRYQPRALRLLAGLARAKVKEFDADVLRLAIANCEEVLKQPLSGEREELLALCMEFGVDVVDWEEGRAMFRALCTRVVETEPALKSADLPEFAHRPGINNLTEAIDIVQSRRLARRRALAFLAWCDEMEPRQVKEGSGQERALAEAPQQKGGSSEDGDSGSKAGRPAAGQSVRPPTGPRTSEGESTPAVRWFIDGREMGK